MRAPFLIKIPPGLKPWEVDNLKALTEISKMSTSTTNKVDSPTMGLSAIQGKVKIDEYDSTANYLEEKLIAGTGITLTEGLTGGAGSKTLTAAIGAHADLTDMPDTAGTVTDHDTRLVAKVQAAEPSTPAPFPGMIWFDTDAVFGTPFTIGDGEAGVDYEIKVDGETNDGSFYWMEDEDYFKWVDHILLDSTTKLYLRDTDIYINSTDDGYLDLAANTGIRVTKAPRATTSLYRRYYHLPLGSANPGASGATWVVASANTTGGWRLTNATWLLRAQADVHSDWDGASDLTVNVNFMVNINNTGGGVGDTVDLKITAYYKGIGDTATKSQVVEVPTIVGQSAQYKQFKATFTIDWDASANVVEVGDIIAIILNLETDTSEVDDIVVTSMEFFYQTTHLGIESGDT